jgi:hypothetical protein
MKPLQALENVRLVFKEMEFPLNLTEEYKIIKEYLTYQTKMMTIAEHSRALTLVDNIFNDCKTVDLNYVSKHNLMGDILELKELIDCLKKTVLIEGLIFYCPACFEELDKFMKDKVIKFCPHCGEELKF